MTAFEQLVWLLKLNHTLDDDDYDLIMSKYYDEMYGGVEAPLAGDEL